MSNLWCPHCGSKNKFVRNGSRFNSHTGIREKKLRCNECRRSTTRPLDFDPNVNVFDEISRPLPKTQRYVITAAQNATPPHQRFLESLVHYCHHNDAELLVIPFRYRNPTSLWGQIAKQADWWHEDVRPFLFCDRVDLNKNLSLLGDIRTQPTAVKPLTGLEGLSSAKSGIIAHPKLQLIAVATPAHKLPKIMTTTGAVTKENYTDSLAGKKGEFHHTLGAAVVELDGEEFHLRQINALKNGTFIDLDKKYTPNGVENAPPAAALIMGDSHIQFIDPKVVTATFTDKKSIVNCLRPKQLVWHDALDFYSQNHHHASQPFVKLAKRQSGIDNVPKEVKECCEFINKHTPKGTKSVLVASNHNEGLERWIREHDWRTDPSHMEFYLETALAMVRSTEMREHGSWTIDPFHYWAKKHLTCDTVFLERDDPYPIQGIECGFHGDEGPGGSRGSAEAFKRIGAKTVIGHLHKPEIAEGCYQVGTNSRLRLEYNTGPSGWLQTDCVIYANGKRSLINVIDGRWRL